MKLRRNVTRTAVLHTRYQGGPAGRVVLAAEHDLCVKMSTWRHQENESDVRLLLFIIRGPTPYIKSKCLKTLARRCAGRTPSSTLLYIWLRSTSSESCPAVPTKPTWLSSSSGRFELAYISKSNRSCINKKVCFAAVYTKGMFYSGSHYNGRVLFFNTE